MSNEADATTGPATDQSDAPAEIKEGREKLSRARLAKDFPGHGGEEVLVLNKHKDENKKVRYDVELVTDQTYFPDVASEQLENV